MVAVGVAITLMNEMGDMETQWAPVNAGTMMKPTSPMS